MAAAITTTATSLEAQLFEVAQAIHNAELGIAENIRPDRIQIDPTLETKTVTVTVNLDVNTTIGTNGAMTVTVVPYLP
jgi:hypothetical protein